MDEKKLTPLLTPFDEMISQEPVQILKASIPYFPAQSQKMLSILTKMMELKRTMTICENASDNLISSCAAAPQLQPMEILNQISPYCSTATQERISNMIAAFSAISLFQSFQENEE